MAFNRSAMLDGLEILFKASADSSTSADALRRKLKARTAEASGMGMTVNNLLSQKEEAHSGMENLLDTQQQLEHELVAVKMGAEELIWQKAKDEYEQDTACLGEGFRLLAEQRQLRQNLQLQSRQVVQDIAELTQKKSAALERSSKLKVRGQEVDDVTSSLRLKLAQAREHNENLKRTIAVKRQQAEALREELPRQELDIETKKLALSDLKDQQRRDEGRKSEVEAELHSQDVRLQQLLASVGSQTKLSQDVESVKTEVTELRTASEPPIEQLESELQEVQERVETQQGETEDYQNSLRAKQSELSALEQACGEASRSTEQTLAENRRLVATNEEIRGRVSVASVRLADKRKELKQAMQAIRAARSDLGRARESTLQMGQAETAFSKEMEQEMGSGRDKEAHVQRAAQKSRLTELQAHERELAEGVERARSELEAFGKDLNQLKQQSAAFAAEIQKSEADKSKFAEEKAARTKAYSELAGRVEELRTEVGGLETQIAQNKAAYEEELASQADLEKQQQASESSERAREQMQEAWKSQAEAFEHESEANEHSISALKESMRNLRADVDRIEK